MHGPVSCQNRQKTNQIDIDCLQLPNKTTKTNISSASQTRAEKTTRSWSGGLCENASRRNNIKMLGCNRESFKRHSCKDITWDRHGSKMHVGCQGTNQKTPQPLRARNTHLGSPMHNVTWTFQKSTENKYFKISKANTQHCRGHAPIIPVRACSIETFFRAALTQDPCWAILANAKLMC